MSTKPVNAITSSSVALARQRWIQRLIDTSRRNNLLYYRPSKTGTLDLSSAPANLLRALLDGDSVPIHKLLLPPTSDVAAALARISSVVIHIRRRAQANLEDKSIETLYMTMGMASWQATDGGRNAEAAILLLPVEIDLRGRDGRNAQLRISGEPQFNLALAYVLKSEFGVKLDEEALLTMPTNDQGQVGDFDPHTVYQRLQQACANIAGFVIAHRAVLGNFSFQKMAMVRDLQDYAEQLATHPIIGALAGDVAAQKALSLRAERDPVPSLDSVPPDQDFTILDADSSQQYVVMAVCKGQSGVIQGPPGTGKSQTIVNMIVALAAQGKRVLFVAEKRAALEVVKDRLDRVGVGRLVLDLHGADFSQRELMRRVADGLAAVREASPAVDTTAQHAQFTDVRQRLNEHVTRLHTLRAPAKKSVFELQGELLRSPAAVQSALRWRGADLAALTPDVTRRIEAQLEEATAISDLITRKSPSLWVNADLKEGTTTAQVALDAAQALAQRDLQLLRSSTQQLAQATQLPVPNNLHDTEAFLKLLAQADELLQNYLPNLFEQALEAWANALAPAKNAAAALWAQLTNGAYRRAKAGALALRHDKAVKPSQLKYEMTQAAVVLARWQKLALGQVSSGKPQAARFMNAEATSVVLPHRETLQAALLNNAKQQYEVVMHGLTTLSMVLAGETFAAQPLDALQARLTALANDADSALQVPHARRIERELTQAGAGKFLDELKQTACAPDQWVARFHYAWLSSALDAARVGDSKLVSFNGRNHDKLATDFAKLDKQGTAVNTARVLRAHAERAIASMNTHPDQTVLVRREAEKKSRHLPLRKLIAQAPDVLTALFPCWMASPLSVSQLLDGKRRYFDVVLFDEASQILPEDAVCALLRAEHAVVAGDKHQLPPTQFFAAGDDDDDENATPFDADSGTGAYESLLDVMQSFLPPWMLEWHYRSKDESLIAFSNRHIYQNRLVTFPGAHGAQALQHVLVQATPSDSQADGPSAEVHEVVRLILQHAATHPQQSLGVIALGLPHAKRIQAALDLALNAQPTLDPFFDEKRDEYFFIKNLERVQGDERDAIILTIGYGKDASGKLPYRFGPLLYDGGERRLNVAVTRARYRLTLVSAFDDGDMDPSRSKARGVELLRHYIQFARSGGARLGDGAATDVALNPFEADVFDALTARGIKLIPQWGSSRYRIDFAVQHPQQPGRFVLALECDGASYHSSPSARDRDRLRQQQLQALGWRFHRIWSTDWFLRRDDEIARMLQAYEQALLRADAPPATLFEPALLPTSSRTLAAQGVAAHIRPARPNVPRGLKIDDYPESQLRALAAWIKTDGKLRTHDELVDAMIEDLAFSRRGKRIVEVLGQAVRG